MENTRARVIALVKMPMWRKEKWFLWNTRISQNWLQSPEHQAPVLYRGMVPQKFSFTRRAFFQAPISHLITSAYQTDIYLLLTSEAQRGSSPTPTWTSIEHPNLAPCLFGPLFETKSSTPSPGCSSKPLPWIPEMHDFLPPHVPTATGTLFTCVLWPVNHCMIWNLCQHLQDLTQL